MDLIEMAQEHVDAFTDEALKKSGYGYVLPKGVPGECHLCGEESLRLIGGACAPCRDKYKLS